MTWISISRHGFDSSFNLKFLYRFILLMNYVILFILLLLRWLLYWYLLLALIKYQLRKLSVKSSKRERHYHKRQLRLSAYYYTEFIIEELIIWIETSIFSVKDSFFIPWKVTARRISLTNILFINTLFIYLFICNTT